MDNEDIARTAIIMNIPTNRKGLVQVTFDGTGVEDMISVNKLSCRYNKQLDLVTQSWFYVDKTNEDADVTTVLIVHSEKNGRYATIQKRKVQYEVKLEAAYQRRVVASALVLQCAWRSKKARERFEYSLQLRGREIERNRLVVQTAKKAQNRNGWFKKFRR